MKPHWVFDLSEPQILHLVIFLQTSDKAFAIGFASFSCYLLVLRQFVLADFGPKPGNFEISLIRFSISSIFCMFYSGHLKPGMPKPPAAFDISSEVLDLSFSFALL